MNKIKIVFFDIDGTLINYGAEKLTDKTLEALKELKNNGIKIVLATGRAPVSLPDFGDLIFDAKICFNGSLCFTDDKTIYSNPINKNDVYQLVNNATKLDKVSSIATKNKIAANGIEESLKDYFSIANLILNFTPDFDNVLKNEDVFQVMLAATKDEYNDILDKTTDVKIAAWWDRAIDIIPINGGKGQGIRKILEYFNISKDEAMAFGDGNNDLEMFSEVKYSIAMDNASNELKSKSFNICKDVKEDGIYYYLKDNNII